MPATPTALHIEAPPNALGGSVPDIDEETEMTFFSNLQRLKLHHVLVWGALSCWPVAQAFGAQPQENTVRATATITRAGWAATGSLNVARSGHTATLLSDGKVLVVGGTRSAFETELYDPTAGTWIRTGDDVCAEDRKYIDSNFFAHVQVRTATLLTNGKVLVAGPRCAELYDPVTGTWMQTGSMNVARTRHTASRLADGTVLVAGGATSSWYADTASAEIYDPITGVWTLTGALAGGRYGHTSTVLRDGRVLVAGGHTIAEYAWMTWAYYGMEIFDPLKGTWTNVGSPILPRDSHTATLLPSGKVLVAGGQDDGGLVKAFEVFDPATGTSSIPGYLNFPRELAVATALPNGDVFLTGGGSIWGTPANVLHFENTSDAETYDTTSGKWLLAGQQITPRMGHTATLLRDGRVLVAGGVGSGDAPALLASAELYATLSPGTIGASYTGSWYDPAQVGHGIFVEVLTDNRFLAAWFTFDPAGTQQSWFLGVGTYSGDTATVSAVYQPTGGRWIPNFDPSRVVNNRWGTLKFTFTDCNHGKVEFASSAGYGTGSMNLTRLTQPAGLTCP